MQYDPWYLERLGLATKKPTRAVIDWTSKGHGYRHSEANHWTIFMDKETQHHFPTFLHHNWFWDPEIYVQFPLHACGICCIYYFRVTFELPSVTIVLFILHTLRNLGHYRDIPWYTMPLYLIHSILFKMNIELQAGSRRMGNLSNQNRFYMFLGHQTR